MFPFSSKRKTRASLPPPFSPPPFTVDTNSLILLYEPKSSAVIKSAHLPPHFPHVLQRKKCNTEKSEQGGRATQKIPLSLLFFRLRICQSRDARIHFTFCPPGRRTEKREREKNPYFHIHSAFASTQQHAVIWLGRQSLFLTRKKSGGNWRTDVSRNTGIYGR